MKITEEQFKQIILEECKQLLLEIKLVKFKDLWNKFKQILKPKDEDTFLAIEEIDKLEILLDANVWGTRGYEGFTEIDKEQFANMFNLTREGIKQIIKDGEWDTIIMPKFENVYEKVKFDILDTIQKIDNEKIEDSLENLVNIAPVPKTWHLV